MNLICFLFGLKQPHSQPQWAATLCRLSKTLSLLTTILATKAVERFSVSLERVDHVHGRDGLPPGVLGVRSSVLNDILHKRLENRASLLVDEARDALHPAAARQTANSWLGNALDIVAEHCFAVALCTTLAQALPAFSAARHFDLFNVFHVVSVFVCVHEPVQAS